MEPFLAEILMFGGNFAPRGWAFCDGQLLAINQYQALFSLLGTTYGGDGRGLSPRSLGQKSGLETNTLNVGQLPSHNHTFNLPAKEEGNEGAPDGAFIAGDGTASFGTTSDVTLGTATTNNTGGNQAVNNLQPYNCVNFIIALQGTFPSRN